MDSVTEAAQEGMGEALTAAFSVDVEKVRGHLDQVVRASVEQTLNALLDAEAERVCQAGRYERSPERQDTRAGSYERKLQTKAGEVTLKVPRLRKLPLETAIIERYRRRESSVEEALIEMYLAGVSVRRVEDITEALWGTRVSPSTVSELNQKIYGQIEAWRNRPIEGEHAYVYLDGIWLKRSWGGEVKNVAVLVAIGVNQEGFREILGVAEGAREDAESWRTFLRHLKERGLKGVRLFISDKCLGLVEALGEFYPEAAWQRCVAHFYRNVLSVTPKGRARAVAAMLKAIHAQEDRESARQKAEAVVAKLEAMKLPKAAQVVREGIEQTLSHMAFPREHWRCLRTNNPLERLNREIRRRTRVVGAFPDGTSALMLVAARLRHIAGTRWGLRRYLDMGRLGASAEIEPEAAA
ncbi:transposase [Methylocaldum szegediense]|jgi:putative transposase|uniref:Mutator family transposase n=2 Tax=Methylocaldum szegediense TaxID=73780 RepID=A0ABM9I336_9GAMM|nr:transposase [Methylocaldum szegediense]